jgi:hypothetical protein
MGLTPKSFVKFSSYVDNNAQFNLNILKLWPVEERNKLVYNENSYVWGCPTRVRSAS